MPVQPQFARQQIDTRSQYRPHNRIRGYGEDPQFSPDNAIPLPQTQQQQSQAPASTESSAFGLGELLGSIFPVSGSAISPITRVSGSQLPGISGLSAGGGVQVGPDGISVSSPNQSQMYGDYVRALAETTGDRLGVQGSMFSDVANYATQMGTAGIGADAQRDVAGIQGRTQENVALTQARSAEDVANIQAASANQIEQLRQAGLISELESRERLQRLQVESDQRIAEIQAQASVRPAELQYQTFSEGLESIRPFMQALLGQFGGGIAGSTDSNQIDPNALVNAAQAANAQSVASQQRAGAPSGGSPATEAASRAGAQQLAALNARDAFQIPFDVNQQNFQNRQTSQNTNNAILGNLLRVITG